MDVSKKKKGLELKRTPRGEKIYRGAFDYYRGDNIYSEEEFEVWKESQNMTYSIFSKLHSRVATGELLTIYVDYQCTKDFVPENVLVEKALGKELVTEIYNFNKKENLVDYLFISKEGQVHDQINSSPKFHIATPTAASSMLFLRSKKEDTTSKNFYITLQSNNDWKFKELPSFKNITMQRISTTAEDVKINGSTVSATEYKLFEDSNNDEEDYNPAHLNVFMSKHLGIPYSIQSEDGTKILVKYLNDLNSDS